MPLHVQQTEAMCASMMSMPSTDATAGSTQVDLVAVVNTQGEASQVGADDFGYTGVEDAATFYGTPKSPKDAMYRHYFIIFRRDVVRDISHHIQELKIGEYCFLVVNRYV